MDDLGAIARADAAELALLQEWLDRENAAAAASWERHALFMAESILEICREYDATIGVWENEGGRVDA